MTDPSEGEPTGADEGLTSTLFLYARVPHQAESGTEGGDESGLVPYKAGLNEPSTSGTSVPRPKIHELSRKNMALLKEYFETTDAVSLPIGYPTVIFSESQLYHLLKILTIGTMSMTNNTIKRMVLDAVKRVPTTSQSCTDHFKVRNRAQTPRRGNHTDSSFDSDPESEASTHADKERRRF